MGIPKLSHDLAQYGELAVFGTVGGSEAQTSVDKVVIDGPALVYFIYYRLLSCVSESIPLLDAQPSYEKIAKTTIQFLTELRSSGVEM